MTLNQLMEGIHSGRITFAPPPVDAYLSPDFVEKFCRVIFHTDWKWIGASGMASLEDFTNDGETVEDILARIKEVYGTDCSDIRDLNFWEVLKCCEEAHNHDHRSVESRADAVDSRRSTF
jgi:hypothetical protein